MILFEGHGVRADGILEAAAGAHGGFHVKVELRLLAGAVEVVEDPEAPHCIQALALGIQLGQPGGQLPGCAAEKGSGLLHVPLVGGNGQVALLLDAAGSPGDLTQEHLVVLLPEAIQPVPLHGQQDGVRKVLPVDTSVVDGQFRSGSGVQGVQQFGVPQEHLSFVLLAGDGIVDVTEPDGLGELGAELKNAIPPYALDGDGVLNRLGHLHFHLVLLQCVLQGLNQSAAPP